MDRPRGGNERPALVTFCDSATSKRGRLAGPSDLGGLATRIRPQQAWPLTGGGRNLVFVRLLLVRCTEFQFAELDFADGAFRVSMRKASADLCFTSGAPG